MPRIDSSIATTLPLTVICLQLPVNVGKELGQESDQAAQLRPPRSMPRLRRVAATSAAGLAAAGEVAGAALLDSQLTVWVVGGLRVARGVEGGGFGWAEMEVSSAKVGLELLGRAGAEDCRGYRGPIVAHASAISAMDTPRCSAIFCTASMTSQVRRVPRRS